MYGKWFLVLARIVVAVAASALVAGTLFGSISPVDPTLDRTKREIMDHRFVPTCGFALPSKIGEDRD